MSGMKDQLFREQNGGGATDTTPSCLTEALRYADELGWTVFPVPPGTKKSHKSKKHSNGINWGATSDPEQIERDFKKWPQANVGIPTGTENGIFVIDADTIKGHGVDGIANFQTLIDANSPLPETRMAESPTGSNHYYFKYPEGVKITNSDSKLAPGVDVRAEGGMVVAPPSVKPGVGTYEWISEADIADAPQWLLDLVIEKEGERKPSSGAEPKAVDLARLAERMALIPNDDAGWEKWNTVGLALYSATGGSDDGKALFITHSMKSKKFDRDVTEDKWKEFHTSPPDKITAASIFFWSKEAEATMLVAMLLQKGAGDYSSSDELLAAFLNKALQSGVDDSKIIHACLDEKYSGNGIFEHVKENGGEEYIKGQIAAVLNEPPAATTDQKAVIRCKKGERHIINDRTQAALIKAECPVYHRGGALVEPLWRWEKTSEKNREMLVTSLMKLNIARLSYMTAKHAASFYKYNAKTKRWEVVDPPKDVIEQLLELGHWGFPTIKGIINSPTMRADGSLLTEPGYDKATQLWFKSSGDIEMPTIPERPTKEDAQRALELLTGLLAEFPFKDDKGISKAVAIAGLMTPVLRGAFEFAPMFLILAPEPGSGKSYLVNVTGTLATGRAPMPMALSENKEERDKQLSAAAFGAKPILHLNNLDFDLESHLLNTMITEGALEIRPFGKNDQTISCDCRSITIFANGNNIRIIGDLVRRTLTCRIDANEERPEAREFNFDPVEDIKKDRGKYLAAVFTIARAYMATGTIVEASPLAGFDGWTRMVRHPLIWLGMADPVKSMEDARALDPERATLRQRVEALAAEFGTGTFTAADIDHKINALNEYGRPKDEHPELRDAFARPEGKKTNSRSIGNQLMKDLDRVSGGCRIQRISTDVIHGHQYQINFGDRGKAEAADKAIAAAKAEQEAALAANEPF